MKTVKNLLVFVVFVIHLSQVFAAPGYINGKPSTKTGSKPKETVKTAIQSGSKAKAPVKPLNQSGLHSTAPQQMFVQPNSPKLGELVPTGSHTRLDLRRTSQAALNEAIAAEQIVELKEFNQLEFNKWNDFLKVFVRRMVPETNEYADLRKYLLTLETWAPCHLKIAFYTNAQYDLVTNHWEYVKMTGEASDSFKELETYYSEWAAYDGLRHAMDKQYKAIRNIVFRIKVDVSQQLHAMEFVQQFEDNKFFVFKKNLEADKIIYPELTPLTNSAIKWISILFAAQYQEDFEHTSCIMPPASELPTNHLADQPSIK